MISPNLPGRYLAGLHADPGFADYLMIGNPSASAVTARLTWVLPAGAWVICDLTLAAQQRVTIYIPDEPGLSGQSDVSVVVQSTNTALAVDVEHVAHCCGWRGCTSAGRPANTVVERGTR